MPVPAVILRVSAAESASIVCCPGTLTLIKVFCEVGVPAPGPVAPGGPGILGEISLHAP